jgi:HPt (histidine-containing phosphotransfer) domain-containing protein
MAAKCEPDAAIARLGGDRELYRDLVRSFLSDSSGLIPRLESGIQASDPVDVHKAAHNLKGTAATCGAVAVAGVCARLESTALAGNLSAADSLLAELRSEIGEAACQLASYGD